VNLYFFTKNIGPSQEYSLKLVRGVFQRPNRSTFHLRKPHSAPMKPDEQILVVRRSLLEQLGMFHGLNFEVDRYLPALLARENNFFMARSLAETDPSHKQIIPYVLLVHEGRVLHYVRGKKAGEQRLVAKGSVGIGGHMNDGDEHLFALDRDAYNAGVEREVNEELRIGTAFTNRIVALLNDDSNPVGQVHLGVVHVFQLATDAVEKREAMITNLAFLTREELLAKRDALESWSQICVDSLDRILAATGAA
jgi:predicted NUDIX family phosphoesterase